MVASAAVIDVLCSSSKYVQEGRSWSALTLWLGNNHQNCLWQFRDSESEEELWS